MTSFNLKSNKENKMNNFNLLSTLLLVKSKIINQKKFKQQLNKTNI